MNQLRMFLVDLFSLSVVGFHLFIAALPTIILLMTVVLIAYQIRYYRKMTKNINTAKSNIE